MEPIGNVDIGEVDQQSGDGDPQAVDEDQDRGRGKENDDLPPDRSRRHQGSQVGEGKKREQQPNAPACLDDLEPVDTEIDDIALEQHADPEPARDGDTEFRRQVVQQAKQIIVEEDGKWHHERERHQDRGQGDHPAPADEGEADPRQCEQQRLLQHLVQSAQFADESGQQAEEDDNNAGPARDRSRACHVPPPVTHQPHRDGNHHERVGVAKRRAGPTADEHPDRVEKDCRQCDDDNRCHAPPGEAVCRKGVGHRCHRLLSSAACFPSCTRLRPRPRRPNRFRKRCRTSHPRVRSGIPANATLATPPPACDRSPVIAGPSPARGAVIFATLVVLGSMALW